MPSSMISVSFRVFISYVFVVDFDTLLIHICFQTCSFGIIVCFFLLRNDCEDSLDRFAMFRL